MNENINTSGYEKKYSDSSFWDKVGRFAKKAGLSVIYAGLLLNEVLKNPLVPAKEKAIIMAALGYFISPLDIIPDITPVAGYSDDLIALGMALTKVKFYITDSEKAKAKAKLKEWFKNFTDDDLKEVDKFL